MPYRFLEEEATADIAFEAQGKDLEEVFRESAEAVMNVMVENLDGIEAVESRTIEVENEQLDLLLHDLLQQLVYYKDAEQLLLRVDRPSMGNADGKWHLRALGRGEPIDLQRHRLIVDVKAVTMHDFRLEQANGGWRAHVILDI
ncbi:MAG: archease [Chloroflexi bacterium]|nr:archease [Chloroflexota bacterium]